MCGPPASDHGCKSFVAKDRGESIEADSRALRHKHTKPTETFDGRIRADNAFAEIARALSGPRVHATGETRPGRGAVVLSETPPSDRRELLPEETARGVARPH